MSREATPAETGGRSEVAWGWRWAWRMNVDEGAVRGSCDGTVLKPYCGDSYMTQCIPRNH